MPQILGVEIDYDKTYTVELSGQEIVTTLYSLKFDYNINVKTWGALPAGMEMQDEIVGVFQHLREQVRDAADSSS